MFHAGYGGNSNRLAEEPGQLHFRGVEFPRHGSFLGRFDFLDELADGASELLSPWGGGLGRHFVK